MEGETIQNTNVFKRISPSDQENDNIHGFGFASAPKQQQKREARRLRQKEARKRQMKEARKRQKMEARKHQKKSMISPTKPCIDPLHTIAADSIYKVLLSALQDDKILSDYPQHATLFYNFKHGVLTKEDLIQKLAEHCASNRC